MTEDLCIRCMLSKPRTKRYWRERSTCRDGLEPRVCRSCRSIERRALEAKQRAAARAAKGPPAPRVTVGRLCPECYGMAHRVEWKRCLTCGLPRAEEPRPELQLRRSVG